MRIKNERRLLSERDRTIIALIAEGYSFAGISESLGIKETTVRKQVRMMMQEHGFTTPFQLITWAYQDAIIV